MPGNSVDASDKAGPVRWAAETHVGAVREENQDTFFADPHVSIFLVSDGATALSAGKGKVVREDACAGETQNA